MQHWNRTGWSAFYKPFYIDMLFTVRKVRMGKNCALGLEYGLRPQAEGRTQDQGHSFFPYGPPER